MSNTNAGANGTAANANTGGATDTSAYSSFSGIDIIAVVDTTVIATLQGISYSITREKAPIYTFGYANPRSFSRKLSAA